MIVDSGAFLEKLLRSFQIASAKRRRDRGCTRFISQKRVFAKVVPILCVCDLSLALFLSHFSAPSVGRPLGHLLGQM